ncbi:DNA recombination protein RmuC [Catenovulum adriaticum]|uniref:DNA recombination protein RmuC n=1 Tax=Catenovulum adriaticum TaxID=2984846 RepID=A0ABY7ANL1_9ALTE|nr:DNA recombination protein RmuC [Catenovulum sp. TS8]WAJ71144.1 DNA recombination protein RmuC [Catenovulum sp. TS8]
MFAEYNWLLLGLIACGVVIQLWLVLLLVSQRRQLQQLNLDKNNAQSQLTDLRLSLMNQTHEQFSALEQRLNQQQSKLQEQQHQSQQSASRSHLELLDLINRNHAEHRQELAKAVHQQSETVSKRLGELANITESRLDKLSNRVNEKLSEGFENTVKTFNDILKRLALIDQAQQKISELSGNVVSLQNVLTDKRSRGAFGEVQLYNLIENTLASEQFEKQAKLSNGRIADCLLKLPEPTGNIVIDSKFPLENYQRMMADGISEIERKAIERQFKADVKKHVQDIAERYIIEKETSDSAILFLPAEAVFAEIHAYHPDIVEFAWQRRVWLTSPTTLMAILTTAKAVLKDEATRQQVHVIQQHLIKLSSDFNRFQGRFDQLARHIDQAANDVKQIHTSASKITNRFQSIEQVKLDEIEQT